MPNKFLRPGQERAAKVQDLFAAVASRYDLINDLQSFGLHRRWKRRVAALARVPADRWVLDLCCGTGDIALRLSLEGCQVVAVDFSDPMLAIARQRAAAGGADIQLARGDALRLPFRNGRFGAVTIGYGLRNLSDVEAGLREICRVLEPEGRVVILDFGKPRARLLRAAYFGYLKFWVPAFGRWLCGDAATYGYILESLRRYPAQEGVAALMVKLGFRGVRVDNLLGGTMSIHSGAKGP